MNQIDVVVNLRMHQVEYLVDGRLPDDLSQGLVFSVEELARLKRRSGVSDTLRPRNERQCPQTPPNPL